METKKYIKVTPAGSKKGVVVLAALEDFYRSQKATIEKPTEAEILAAFPEEASSKNGTNDGKEVAELGKANAKLQEELTAVKAALAESEALVKKLTASKGKK